MFKFCIQKTTFAKAIVAVAAIHISGFCWGLDDQQVNSGRWSALMLERSPLTTPATLTRINYISMRAALSKILDGGLYVHEIGTTFPLGVRQSAGVTWMSLIEARYEAAEIYNEQDRANMWLFTYAVSPVPVLSFGLNFTVVQQTLYDDTSQADIGGDVGLMFTLPKHPTFGQHEIGVALQNLGAPELGRREELRSNLRATLSSNFAEDKFETFFDFSFSEIFGKNRRHIALFEPDHDSWVLNLRLSSLLHRNIKVFAMAGIGESGFKHAGVSGELIIPTSVSGRDREFTLAYQHLYMIENQTSNITTYFRAEVGRHRLTPGILLEKAMAMYLAGDTWGAFLTFGQVIAEYPNFRKNDIASYHMALCQEQLKMYDAAGDRYRKQRERYPSSKTLTKCDFGLMNVAYQRRNFDEVLKIYKDLSFIALNDSLIYHSYYMAAQAHLAKGNTAKAKKMLVRIPRTHPEFLFARHSLAVAHNLSDQPDSAELMLKECLAETPFTLAEEEIINRSRMLLGFMHYERASENDSGLAKAVLTLRRVPRGSVYQDEALLGLGWAALKAKQWRDCNLAADALAKSNNPVARPEGLLLKAFVAYQQKDYKKASDILKDAEKASSALVEITKDTLDHAIQRLRAARTDYDSLSAEAERLALSRRPPSVRRRINEITETRKGILRELEHHQSMVEELAKYRKMAHRFATTRDDILYAQASISQLILNETPHKTTIREKILDRKVEELKEELKELEKMKSEQ